MDIRKKLFKLSLGFQILAFLLIIFANVFNVFFNNLTMMGLWILLINSIPLLILSGYGMYKDRSNYLIYGIALFGALFGIAFIFALINAIRTFT